MKRKSWFGCPHQFSFPIKRIDGTYYQVCVLCGREDGYDWLRMRKTKTVRPSIRPTSLDATAPPVKPIERPVVVEPEPVRKLKPARPPRPPYWAPLWRSTLAFANFKRRRIGLLAFADLTRRRIGLLLKSLRASRKTTFRHVKPVPAMAALACMFSAYAVLHHRMATPTAPPQLHTMASSHPAEPSSENSVAQLAPLLAKRQIAEKGKAPTVQIPATSAATNSTDVLLGEALVTSQPDEAQFQIEGHGAFNTPSLVSSLKPGHYSLTVTKSGYLSRSLEFDVSAGGRAKLVANLIRKGAVVKVASTPEGAAILIDGKVTSFLSPADVPIENNGPHTLTLRKPGYIEAHSDVKLKDGEDQFIAMNLLPAGDSSHIKVVGKLVGEFRHLLTLGASKEIADVQFRTSPKGAEVKLNGWPAPKHTPCELKLPPGGYELVLQAEGFRPITKTIVVQAGQKSVLSEVMEPTIPTSRSESSAVRVAVQPR